MAEEIHDNDVSPGESMPDKPAVSSGSRSRAAKGLGISAPVVALAFLTAWLLRRRKRG